MKHIKLVLFVLLCSISFGYGQTKLAELTFETPGGYTTDIAEFTGGLGNSDYFTRTDGSNTSGVFLNLQGSFYFAAQDIDAFGDPLPLRFLMDDVNINGYASLEFRVHLAEDDESTNEDWDVADFVHFNYDIDNSGTFMNLLWIENDGVGFNSVPLIDNDFNGDGDGAAITETFVQFTRNIAGTGSLLDIEIVFSLNSGEEDIAIDNIEIWGVPFCPSTTTWETVAGITSWDSGVPTSTTTAVLDADYNTLTDGNITACSLTVNSGITLSVGNNSYVEIENDVTNNGTVNISDEGSFVQVNDASTYSNVGAGITQVNKLTASISAWYEYTYWSSPVQGEQIGDTFVQTNPDRRFYYNAANFSDAFAETGNNNDTTTPGQDDIDDNGNDWQYALSGDVMQPGVGYACTISQAYFNTLPPMATSGEFAHSFIGPLNNGVYTTPVYRNEAEPSDLDTNWNFIGNPYASAIDVDLFFAANVWTATDNFPMEGAIYLWSHNSAPSDTVNGNSALNFPNSDYAVINYTGATAAAPTGDGVIPNRFIPSGQGFFIAMSDSYVPSVSSSSNSDGETVEEGEVIFRNDMRVTGNNDQFFKSSNTTSNKLWLDLESDNGIFSQILVGYVDNATDNDDGMSFDATKNISTGYNAFMYSTIEGSDKKYGIQGKATSSIDIDEEIPLGIYNTISVATLFTISIAQFEGVFFDNNTIYIEDSLMNTVHNLSNSDYTFTSEVGEFNDRFKIVFNTNTLSTEQFEASEQNLSIIELQNDNVKFSIKSGNLTIKAIKIIDVLGRELYNFKGNNSSEIFKLSNLSSAAYIAQIELSNGKVITKKAIKK